MIGRRRLLRGAGAAAVVLAAPPIIQAVRRAYFPGYGRWQFEEVAQNVFVPRTRLTGWEVLEELFGIKPAMANFTPPPNDTSYSSQWFLTSLGMTAAWGISQGDSGTCLAILDTGVTLGGDYPANLNPNGYNFISGNTTTTDIRSVSVGHGSIVASIAQSATNNSLLSAGIAPNCSILPIICCDSAGSVDSTAVVNSITWAADNGGHILNMSFTDNQVGATLPNTCAYAQGKGCTLVGGFGDASSSTPTVRPATISGVIGVSGIDSANNLWVQSGVSVGSGGVGSGYNGQLIMAYSGGTTPVSNQGVCATTKAVSVSCVFGNSFAIPQVTGVLGLMRKGATSRYDWLQPDELYKLLLSSTTATGTSTAYSLTAPQNSPAPDQFYGYGRLNAGAAVTAASTWVRPSPLGGF